MWRPRLQLNAWANGRFGPLNETALAVQPAGSTVPWGGDRRRRWLSSPRPCLGDRSWHTIDETTIPDDGEPRFCTKRPTRRSASRRFRTTRSVRLERLGIEISYSMYSMRYKTRLGNPFAQMRYLLRVGEKIVWAHAVRRSKFGYLTQKLKCVIFLQHVTH